MNIAIVGSNRGIGLEFVRQLVGQNSVYAFCRTASTELKNLSPSQIIEGFDVTSEESIAKGLEQLTASSLDWVIHVSGVLKSSNLSSFKSKDLQDQFMVNSVAPLVTARAFLPLLSKGSKIGFLTSRMGSITDCSEGYYGYRMSKAALNIGGVAMAHEIENLGIGVLMLHPGYVRTDMTGGNGEIDPPESVKGLLKIMKEKDLTQTGSFWHTNGSKIPW